MKEARKKGRIIVRKNKAGWWEYDIIVVWPNDEWERERKKSPRPTESTTFEWARTRENIIFKLGPPSERRTTTFSQFMPQFRAMHYPNGPRGPITPSQVRSIESHWKQHIESAFGDVEIATITKTKLDAFKAELQKPHQLQKNAEHVRKPKTVNNVLTTLNTMLARAEEWEVVRVKLPRAKLFRVPKGEIAFYDFDELERLVDGAKMVSWQCHLLVLIGARAGLRAGELIGLAPGDIDMKRGEILVQRSEVQGIVGPPKSGKPRRVPMPHDLIAALKANPMVGRERIFLRADTSRIERAGKKPGKNALRCSIETMHSWLVLAEKRAGLIHNGKGLHRLRHTYASHLVMSGASLKQVQELLGHEHIETTMRYAHLAPRAIDDAVALLNVPKKRFAQPLPSAQ